MENKVIREPIQLSPHAVAVIHIFKRKDIWEDLWMVDSEQYEIERTEMWENAAKQFVEQLDGQWCTHFMECLKKEIDNKIKEHDDWVKKANEKRNSKAN